MLIAPVQDGAFDQGVVVAVGPLQARRAKVSRHDPAEAHAAAPEAQGFVAPTMVDPRLKPSLTRSLEALFSADADVCIALLHRNMPPEASTRCPFTHPVSRLTNAAIAAPMSSGWPARPNAVTEATN